jgi:RNA polymerase primary sigma factor
VDADLGARVSDKEGNGGRKNMANRTMKFGSEGLSHYLRHLGDHSQLTREQEYELAGRARKGDESARQLLAKSNLAFVVAVAKKFSNRGARLDDLIQEGNVGLMDFSLDASIDEEGETTFLDRLEDGGPSPQEVFLFNEQNTEVQEALAKVRKRIGDLGWDILTERLTQDKPRTLEELGQRWGVSRERVRQVELKTKNFLERYLAAFNQDEEQQDSSSSVDAA